MAANSALKKSALDDCVTDVAAAVIGSVASMTAFSASEASSCKSAPREAPIFQIELTVKGSQFFLEVGLEQIIVLRCRFDHVADMVVGVAAEAGGVVQIGALFKQRSQFRCQFCDVLVDVGEITARGARLLHLLGIPECGRAQHQSKKDLERRGRIGVELVVQFFVGILQLYSAGSLGDLMG